MKSKSVDSLGIVGNATIDCYLPQAIIKRSNGKVEVKCGAQEYEFHPRESASPGAKVNVAALPLELLAQGQKTVYGGGAFNSYAAFRLIAPETRMLYFDTCSADKELEAQLKSATTEVFFGGLHPIPTSAVLGEMSDKIIFKYPLVIGQDMEVSAAYLKHLDGCDAILANSAKDIRSMSHLASRASRRQLRLYVVLTGSLPPDFVNERILPAASCIFISWDDVMYIGGVRVRKTVDKALHILNCIRDRARASMIFLTMGSDGVVVAQTDRATATHVYLDPQARLSAEMQALAADHPAHVCGCGDAFAAGAFADLETRQSLLVEEDNNYPRDVRAALSGCAAALRRLGYDGPVSEEEFVVSSYRIDGE
jgi:sugar/nucleoside kinase (ribokinase family)